MFFGLFNKKEKIEDIKPEVKEVKKKMTDDDVYKMYSGIDRGSVKAK